MLSYLLYPTLTRAQQASAALARAGVNSSLIRAPRTLSPEGCVHGLRLGLGTMSGALMILNEAGLPPRRAYISAGDGRYEEVIL